MREISVRVRGVEVFVRYEERGQGLPLVLLHGFTGDSRDWAEFAARVPIRSPWLAIDLLGHGKTDLPEAQERYHMQEQVADMEGVFQLIDLRRFFLLGYSLGGRVALSYAVARPERVEGLILESASPGLAAFSEREARRRNDALLAERILKLGAPAFIEEWEAIPLFASQKSLSLEARNRQREIRQSQAAIGLANSLYGMGTGSQPSLWGELDRLRVPILLITGELDDKFTRIAAAMQTRFQVAKHVLVNGAGHNVHLEAPGHYWQAVEGFMKAI